MTAPDLSYREQRDKLADRIRAHKEFANFDVADWIGQFLTEHPSKHLLDVGCGDGNHFNVYRKNLLAGGTITGLDRESSLLDRARETNRVDDGVTLITASMDDPFPLEDGSVDIAFSNFAIYNAREPLFTLKEMHRVLQPDGTLVLIGPTRNNAYELYEFNERLTGIAIDEITLVRTDRLRTEIEPLVDQVFGQVSEEILHSQLTFPTAEEFLRYFTATMLYEQVAERTHVSHEQMLDELRDSDLVVSKEMLALTATR